VNWAASPGTVGSGPWLISASHRHDLLPVLSRPRVCQQIGDHPLHSGGAIDGVGDELAGIAVQLILVARLEKLDVAGHHAQRLLQVVRHDIGKLLQFGVGAGQFLHA
jgi:hypothetical protein